MCEAYRALEPEVLVLIGALTPLSDAVQHSGATDVQAIHLSALLHGRDATAGAGRANGHCDGLLAIPAQRTDRAGVGAGPDRIGLATALHFNPDPFLVAGATGAGCDLPTPVGHQCNTLVMGPGGYRFGDYWRFGLPPSVMVIVVGAPMIAWVWPLTAL